MSTPARDGGNVEPRTMTGRQLGRYEILTELASGGMASVYIARAQGVAGFERLVAIKVLHPHLAYEEEFISMFLDEARLAARIRHMNVVPTIDISDSLGDGYFLVMDYVEGHHLGALLGSAAKKGARLPTPFICRVLTDALQGLGAAHRLTDEKGVPLHLVHRDVSPHNILVGTDGIGRLTDFGVAKAEVRMASTRAGQFKGKLSYMAPEQASSGATDQRSDLFSMGVILWESLTGRRLFKAESNAATLNKLLKEPIPKPSELWKDLSHFDEVTLKALRREPDARFQTADEFMEALESAAEHEGVASARAVARLVRELAADKIEQESDRVREAIGQLGRAKIGEAQMPARGDGAGTPTHVPSRGGTGTGSGTGSGTQASVSGVLADGTPIFVRPSSDSGLLKWTVVGLAALVVVYAAFLGWQFVRRSQAVAPAKQIAPTPTLTTAELPAGAPPALARPDAIADMPTASARVQETAGAPIRSATEADPVEPHATSSAQGSAFDNAPPTEKDDGDSTKKRRMRRSRSKEQAAEPAARAETLARAPAQAAPDPAPAPTPAPEPVDIEIDNPYRH